MSKLCYQVEHQTNLDVSKKKKKNRLELLSSLDAFYFVHIYSVSSVKIINAKIPGNGIYHLLRWGLLFSRHR
jgi:hypothetical protein